jgi:hypothetical protein
LAVGEWFGGWQKRENSFSETDRKLEAAMRPFAERYGFTPDLERVAMELIAREARDFP